MLYKGNEHLPPQNSLQELQSTININYEAASRYYSQRRANMCRLLQQRSAYAIENLQKDIYDILQNSWSKLTKALYAEYNKTGNNMNYNIPNAAAQLHIPQEMIDDVLKANDPRAFATRYGAVFEQFINANILPKLIQPSKNFSKAHSNKLVYHHFGKEVSKSLVTSKASQTRIDHLVSLKNITIDNVNGVQQSSTNIPLEIQGTLEVDLNNAIPVNTNQKQAESQVARLLKKTGQFYGFQAKTYTNLTRARWMNSVPMQNAINQVFNQTDSFGQRHTWQNEYAGVYTTYFLSHQLMAIMNPVNIGLITGKNFIWMDELLKTRRLYMEVSMSNSFGEHKATKPNTGFPQINNSEILFTNYATATKTFKETAFINKGGIIKVKLTK